MAPSVLLILALAASAAGPVAVDGVECAPCADEAELRRLLGGVPKALRDSIPAAKRWFADNARAAGGGERFGPNCHWASLSFSDEARARRPAFVNYDELNPALAANYRELAAGHERRAGDLIVLEHSYREKVVDPEGGPNGRPLIAWIDHVMPIHTAVFLETGRLFQKETPHDDHFSVDSPEAVEKRWRDYIHRGSIRVRAYRRK